jgi:hypothetical protein
MEDFAAQAASAEALDEIGKASSVAGGGEPVFVFPHRKLR